MPTGTLYLLPNLLGAPDAQQPLFDVIPVEVQKLCAGLGHFVAENAKSTRAFLKLVNANYPLTRPLQDIQIRELDVNTAASALPLLLQPLLDGVDVGLISEAGVPAVADPGANLVRLAHQHQIRVRPMVGPSSLLLAVMASGLNGQSFAFNGYLPTDGGQRSKRIVELEQRSRKDRQTQIFIETPYRNGALLDALCKTLQPTTLLCVATDLTLSSESVLNATVGHWSTRIARGDLPDFNRKPTVFLFLA